MRSLADIDGDLRQSRHQTRRLRSERRQHPGHHQRRARRADAHLQSALPSEVWPDVLDRAFAGYGALRHLSLRTRPVFGETGPAVHWTFRAEFAHSRVFFTELVGDRESPLDHFEHVPFCRDARTLWRSAWDTNDHEPAQALAAFCFACAEHVGGALDAEPAVAFVTIAPPRNAGGVLRGKTEVKD
jgi:hypothetical protein